MGGLAVAAGGVVGVPSDAPGDVGQRCHDEHFGFVQMAWERTRPPSEDEIQAARERFAECLECAGLDVPAPVGNGSISAVIDTATSSGDQEAIADWFSCQSVVAEEFGLPGFGG